LIFLGLSQIPVRGVDEEPDFRGEKNLLHYPKTIEVRVG
jgi:hypothetical protein